MTTTEKTLEVDGGHTKRTEVIAEVIAGPETAARLGVPVGSVIESRHVVNDPEKITDEEYVKIKSALEGADS